VKRDRRGRGIYRKRSERSSRTTRGRLEKKREGITLEEKDIYS